MLSVAGELLDQSLSAISCSILPSQIVEHLTHKTLLLLGIVAIILVAEGHLDLRDVQELMIGDGHPAMYVG